MMRWQWHQLDHMQIISTSLQADNHASSTPPLKFFTDQMPFLLPNQQHQSTEGVLTREMHQILHLKSGAVGETTLNITQDHLK